MLARGKETRWGHEARVAPCQREPGKEGVLERKPDTLTSFLQPSCKGGSLSTMLGILDPCATSLIFRRPHGYPMNGPGG